MKFENGKTALAHRAAFHYNANIDTVSYTHLAARRVAKGDYSARVTPRGHDELAVLAQDFNTMTREVARSNELQRDLLANICLLYTSRCV